MKLPIIIKIKQSTPMFGCEMLMPNHPSGHEWQHNCKSPVVPQFPRDRAPFPVYVLRTIRMTMPLMLFQQANGGRGNLAVTISARFRGGGRVLSLLMANENYRVAALCVLVVLLLGGIFWIILGAVMEGRGSEVLCFLPSTPP